VKAQTDLQSRITRMREEAVKRISDELKFIEATLDAFSALGPPALADTTDKLNEASREYAQVLRKEREKYSSRLAKSDVPYIDELRTLKALKAKGYEF
jgi:phosphoglycolate phosphatase-like HAD superfamily hydrolase